MKITSATNPRIKALMQLRESKARREKGLTVVEGAREFERASAAGVSWKEIYHCPTFYQKYERQADNVLQKWTQSQAPLYEVAKDVFEKISFGNRQEGILGVCQTPEHDLGNLKLSARPCCVVVESVEKPGNLGAILRASDGAGVNAVLVCDPQTDLYNPQVIRASLGTVFHLPVVPAEAGEIQQFLKNAGVKIVAAAPQASAIYTDVDLKRAVAFVVGSEDKGLSDFWLKNADERVRIPMKGKADSLNVSHSVAVLVYEALRQRNMR